MHQQNSAARTPTVPAKTNPKLPIGDSLTQGNGNESGPGGYPPRLQKLIETLRPGTQTLNLGKSG
jgi:hypothetical protein